MAKYSSWWNGILLCSTLTLALIAPELGACDPGRLHFKRLKLEEAIGPVIPPYGTLMALSEESQDAVLDSLQAFFLETESEGMGLDENTTAFLDLWIPQAEAGSRTASFCINLGVVKPLVDCGPATPSNIHDFDTSSVLAPLGDSSACGGKGYPCSPVFGFDGSGKLFCTTSNRTRTCAQLSRQPKTISFASMMKRCRSKKASSGPKVQCDQLKKFYDSQVALVNQHCARSPSRKACGILREQLSKIAHRSSKGAVKSTAPKAAADPELRAAVDQAQKVQRVVKASSPTDPCAERIGPCAPIQFPASGNPIFEEVISHFKSAKRTKSSCSELFLQGHGMFRLDQSEDDLSLSYHPQSNGPGKVHAIAISQDDMAVLNLASQALMQEKVASKKLLGEYLPVTEIGEAGEMEISLAEKEPAQKLPTRGWKTASGNRIRYSVVQSDMLLLGLTRDGKEKIFSVKIPMDSEEPESTK